MPLAIVSARARCSTTCSGRSRKKRPVLTRRPIISQRLPRAIDMTTPRAIARPAAASGSVPRLIFGDLWEYDPAPETADPKLKAKYDLFIGGKIVAPETGKYFGPLKTPTAKTLVWSAVGPQTP